MNADEFKYMSAVCQLSPGVSFVEYTSDFKPQPRCLLLDQVADLKNYIANNRSRGETNKELSIAISCSD